MSQPSLTRHSEVGLLVRAVMKHPAQAFLSQGDIEVHQDEFDKMGGNVLAVGPTTVVALAGNSRTRAALEAAGIAVVPYQEQQISLKGSGGPTCLTRPLERRA